MEALLLMDISSICSSEHACITDALCIKWMFLSNVLFSFTFSISSDYSPTIFPSRYPRQLINILSLFVLDTNLNNEHLRLDTILSTLNGISLN